MIDPRKVFRCNKETGYDDNLTRLVNAANNCIDTEDDYLLMIVGETGSGKSTLMLWIYKLFLEMENPPIQNVCLTRTDFGDTLDHVSRIKGKRFLSYDEANVSNRDAMTKFNKELYKVYNAIRGLRIFHVWCNPSLQVIDKPFIQERIRGIIYVPKGENNNKPKRYYFFRRKFILKILEREKNLTIKNLHKYRQKYCKYRGEFKRVEGELWSAYMEKKKSRMLDVVSDFRNQFGSSFNFKRKDIADQLGVSYETIKKYSLRLAKEGVLEDNVHFKMTPAGVYKFNEDAIHIISENIRIINKNTTIKEIMTKKNEMEE